jgi:hypothetical protein
MDHEATAPAHAKSTRGVDGEIGKLFRAKLGNKFCYWMRRLPLHDDAELELDLKQGRARRIRERRIEEGLPLQEGEDGGGVGVSGVELREGAASVQLASGVDSDGRHVRGVAVDGDHAIAVLEASSAPVYTTVFDGLRRSSTAFDGLRQPGHL